MKSSIAALILLTALGCSHGQSQPAQRSHDTGSPPAGKHVVALSDRLEWKDAPPSLPPGAKVAVIEGDMTKPGFFAVRIKAPDGYRVPPHTHPGAERVTILAGTLHLGNGDTFDAANTTALPAGSYSSMPPGMHHFAWCEGETIIQIATIGPWGINYLNPADDPRNQKH